MAILVKMIMNSEATATTTLDMIVFSETYNLGSRSKCHHNGPQILKVAMASTEC